MGRRKKVIEEEIVKETAPVSTTEAEDKPAFKADEEKKYKVVLTNKTSFLNLREGAGQGYPSIARINEGEVLEAAGDIIDNEWVPVKYKGLHGFVLIGKIEAI